MRPDIHRNHKSDNMLKNEVRIVVIGESHVGKTALIQYFVNREFSGKRLPTVTPCLAPVTVNTDRGKVLLQIWDTAGDEKYHSISKVFYRRAEFAVLCFESTDLDCEQNLRYWTNELRSIEPDCRLFIVATKSDLCTDTDKVMDFGQELCNKFNGDSFAITSAKTGSGVAELFQSIAERYRELKDQIDCEVCAVEIKKEARRSCLC